MDTKHTKVQEESGAGAGAGDDSAANDTSSMESHQSSPALPFLVLKTIFAYSNDLKICRQVCREWNNAVNEMENGLPIRILPEILSKSNLADFINLITRKEAQLNCKTVTFLYSVDSLDPLMTLFLETCGNEIKNLKFDCGIELSPSPSSPLLSVSQAFLNLTDVVLEAVKRWPPLKYLLTINHHAQIHFPRLTSLTIRGKFPEPTDPDATVARTNFIVMLLQRAVNLRKLTLNSWNSLNWTKLANNSNVTSELQRLSTIHLECFDFKIDLIHNLWNPLLNLKILEIVLLNEDLTEQFSTLLQHISGTLEELAICSMYRGREQFYATDFYVTFPCEMAQLKTLKLRTGYTTRIICSAPDTLHDQNDSVLALFPKLKSFHQTYKIHLVPERFIVGCPVFWENLLTMKPSTEKDPIGFIHENLTDINFDYQIDSDNIVSNMARSFPHLTKCSLKATKDQFQEIFSLMKDHKIQKLFLTYVQGIDEGIYDFTSSITGFSLEQCTNAELELESTGENQTEKIRPPLTDWKYLSDLTIRVHCELQGSKYLALNSLCVQQVFVHMKQIKRLCLERFKIESKHIVKILENVALEVFDVGLSDIDSVDVDSYSTSTERAALKSTLTAIRKAFPRVQLIEAGSNGFYYGYGIFQKDMRKIYKLQ